MDAEGGEILNNFSDENWNNCTRMKICTDEIAYEIMELKEIWKESCPQIIPVDSFIMKEGISGMEGSLEGRKKIKHWK